MSQGQASADAFFELLQSSSLSAQFQRASIKQQQRLLPIFQHRDSILYLVETSQVVVLIGHTGSGKSTQLPQYLYEAGWTADKQCIACTQPRRVAATSIARRVAQEMDCEVGQAVGYSIRFEDVTSESTRIKYMTDGMLLREMLRDPLLSRYSVIIVDEAHERSLYTDILLTVLKKVIKRRKNLRVIISSATLQAESFASFFGADTTKIISIEGRMYPVDILYLCEPAENYVETTIRTIFNVHLQEPAGDILVFLTGREEITRVCQAVADRADTVPEESGRLLALPLYAGLTQADQMRIFESTPEGMRKVIISTNIAEASVTVDGVVYVIDCGYVKLRAYDPTTKIESLVVTPTSKAAATQRAGRAGRTRPGKCFRLYTSKAWDDIIPDVTVPEIQRANLASPILQLKSLGIENIARLDMISEPPVELVIDALELLYALGALDDYGKLTKPLGERMAELPLPPMMAKVLLQSESSHCMGTILTIAAMMSVENVFYVPDNDKVSAEMEHMKFRVEEGDHLTLYNVYQAFTLRGNQSPKWAHSRFLNYKALARAVSVRKQLARYLEVLGMSVPPSDLAEIVTSESVRRCLVSGYFANVARMNADGSFGLVNGGENGSTVVWAHPNSTMFNATADWVVYSESVEMDGKVYILGITRIERDWLLEEAREYYRVEKRR
ncbi:P-loop containing nucleoside triphosphate hydrolase protein [Limtongia smithiae]|uniref:P-loop containing nucleoside triphosphate hydrolase protein n=1 Tax=Limtongia smithiae TaxID=1125753 RepID=UPI0034CD84F0